MNLTETTNEAADAAARRAARIGRPWTLRVLDAADLTPRLRRVRLTGDDLAEFDPKPGQELILQLPQAGGDPAKRHYTIRRYDRTTGTIDVDIVLHGGAHATPGVAWARNARPGDTIDVRGPRGRNTPKLDADWHLFAGDETAVPAIFAMLESLPAGAVAFAFIEVADETDVLPLAAPAGVSVTWLYRGDAPPGPNALLADAVAAFAFPPGTGHAYTIGETHNVRALREALAARGLPKEQISAEGYWRHGRVGGHDHVDDKERGPKP
jgi:NADPH-dependent ferric siderophore reductase